MRGQFGRHLRQQPPPLHHTVGQVRPHVGEAQLGHAGGDPLLRIPPPLLRQPLPAGRQPHPGPCQRRPHLPVAHPELRSDPRDAVASVAARLQILVQILEAVPAGAFL
jgi:hypothetical protein